MAGDDEKDDTPAVDPAALAEPKQSKVSPVKIILIAALLILMLAAIGIGGFLIYKNVLAPKADPAAAGGHGAAAGDHGAPAEGEHVEPAKIGKVVALDPFIVNLADEGAKRYLKVNISIELSDDKLLEEVEARKPQLRDQILTVLSSKETDEMLSVDGKFALKEELLTRMNSILTTGVIRNLYFVEFVIQ